MNTKIITFQIDVTCDFMWRFLNVIFLKILIYIDLGFFLELGGITMQNKSAIKGQFMFSIEFNLKRMRSCCQMSVFQ